MRPALLSLMELCSKLHHSPENQTNHTSTLPRRGKGGKEGGSEFLFCEFSGQISEFLSENWEIQQKMEDLCKATER